MASAVGTGRSRMTGNQQSRPARVIGPCGEELTLDTLPPADTPRWTIRRKADVVAAVTGGLLGVNEACARYGLSIEELTNWQRALLKKRNARIARHSDPVLSRSLRAARSILKQASPALLCFPVKAGLADRP